MTYDEYRRLIGKPPSIIEQLAMPGSEDIGLYLPERMIELFRGV